MVAALHGLYQSQSAAGRSSHEQGQPWRQLLHLRTTHTRASKPAASGYVLYFAVQMHGSAEVESAQS